MPITPRAKRRRRVLLATTGVTAAVGAGTIAVSDEAKHYAAAIQRTGRVVTTLAICVNEFVSTPTPIKLSSQANVDCLLKLPSHAEART